MFSLARISPKSSASEEYRASSEADDFGEIRGRENIDGFEFGMRMGEYNRQNGRNYLEPAVMRSANARVVAEPEPSSLYTWTGAEVASAGPCDRKVKR